ncbi:MAG TPA: Xaa-Pro peptidase family protein [Fimbriimonas sp.]
MSPLSQLREKMREAEVPALLVSDPTNVGWLTGFSGSYGRVVVTPDRAVFVTDSRYTIQAGEEVREMPVASFSNPKDGDEFLAEQAKELGVTTLGFDASTVTYAWFEKLRDKFAGVELTPAKDLFASLRMVKSEGEIDKVRQACGVAGAAWEHIQRMVQPGVTEYDLMLDLEFYIRRQGAGVAFDTIVVSGERSARPHGKPSEKKLEVGDFVTFDFGATIDGYHSDITRTVVVGEASERHREIYRRVLTAQLAALDAMKPGVEAREIDRIARESLGDLAPHFGHGLGHGLGKVVHDVGRLSPTSEEVLAPGQIWTVEPGVYLEGFGGVRIEDDVLITTDGIEILTKSPKDLLVLPRK